MAETNILTTSASLLPYTVDNGLNENSSSNFRWGGNLEELTTIIGNGFGLIFDTLDTFSLSTIGNLNIQPGGATGSLNDVLLNDGSGNVSWGAPPGGTTDYISNLTLVGDDLTATGVGSAFNTTVDLSPLKITTTDATITGDGDTTPLSVVNPFPGFTDLLTDYGVSLDQTTSENLTMTGSVNLDLATFDSFEGLLTGNTTITVSNTPSTGITFTRNLIISGNAGTETLTLPGTWNLYGEYVVDEINYLTIEFANFTTNGLQVNCFINQPS